MRSALLLVIFTTIVRPGRPAEGEPFRPTPIPLEPWEPRAAPAAPAPPYWEDALRHSVYLTLVRDHVERLVAGGAARDLRDHQLWEHIKTAPFEHRDGPAATTAAGEVARGRLLRDGAAAMRFVEDDERCTDACGPHAVATWAVERVRRRDAPADYHYELTFSVRTLRPSPREPHDPPMRTFTVRETSPERSLDMPQERGAYERTPIVHHEVARPGRQGRQVWFHKNLAPMASAHTGRRHGYGLDFFSSLFSDDEDEYVPPRPERTAPLAPHAHPPYPQYSKISYAGSPSDHQKRLTPYPYKPHAGMHKYSRPIPHPPFTHSQHHFVESDTVGHPYATPPDHRYGPPTRPMKTTRPAVLPTPLPPITPSRNWTVEPETTKSNISDPTTRSPEIITMHKPYSKPRPGPMKINYMPEHVRPPIYNAPPGVFVTMDKKPFKPMPPLKLMTKPYKYNKPMDFRPSPQVLDMQQFSDPDPFRDTAFRPITWNQHENSTTEKIDVAETATPHNNTLTAPPKGKKPPKKHENIKAQRITTSTPEIITASDDSDEESDAMQWANIVSAISKTTPMASPTEKSDIAESSTTTSTTSTTSSTTAAPSTTLRRRTTTTERPETTTTRKPKQKRTRPPPKFQRPDKIKKHKRITTTTSTTKAPEIKVTQDLTPQASSATANKPYDSVNKTQTTSTSSTTTSTTTAKPTTTATTTTTTRSTTTTTTTTSQPSTVKSSSTSSTTQPKIKNRFRQSTLLQKGTSVNHDKWSNPVRQSSEKSKPTVSLPSDKSPPRRKGSNFHGYVSSTTPRNDGKYEKYHEDQGMKNLNVRPLSTTTQSYDETADQYESNSESSDYVTHDDDSYDDPSQSEEEETRDHSEFIFPSTTPSEKTNEVDHEVITNEQVTTSSFSTPKNKTKCKKKKLQNNTSTEDAEILIDQSSSTTSTTSTESSTPSIFEELFGSFTVDSTSVKPLEPITQRSDLQEEGSQKIGHFVKLDDDLQDFLDSLERGGKNVNIEDYEDDNDEPELDDESDDIASARDAPETDNDYHDRPFSLLELMAME